MADIWFKKDTPLLKAQFLERALFILFLDVCIFSFSLKTCFGISMKKQTYLSYNIRQKPFFSLIPIRDIIRFSIFPQC